MDDLTTYTFKEIKTAWESFTTAQIYIGSEPKAPVKAIKKMAFPTFLKEHSEWRKKLNNG